MRGRLLNEETLAKEEPEGRWQPDDPTVPIISWPAPQPLVSCWPGDLLLLRLSLESCQQENWTTWSTHLAHWMVTIFVASEETGILDKWSVRI